MTTTPRKNNEIRVREIAQLLGGELIGDPDITITGVAGIKEAKSGDITFLSNPRYLPFLDRTQASAVITAKDVDSKKKTLIRTSNPSMAFTRVVSYFSPVRVRKVAGIHPTAVIHDAACLRPGVSVGPHAVIEEGVVIGERSTVEANTFVGAGSVIGSDTWIYPQVTIRENTRIGNRVIIHSGAVIGSDGFGYETLDGKHAKIPHTGSVCLEDDVEIGANVCVDRGRFQKTWIKQGTKIDNLVQIAHNAVIGENCLVISQAGISGSSELGNNVVVAGQAGIVGHVTLGDGAVVGAGAGVTKSVPAGQTVLGSPARPLAEQKKIFALIAMLPELFKELSEIKKRITVISKERSD